jgi:hypothetical protein
MLATAHQQRSILTNLPFTTNHIYFLFTAFIPKRLRIYFMFDRKLLTKLSRCAWKVLNLYLTQAVPYDDAKVGAVVALQSFGDRKHADQILWVLLK